MGRIAFFGLPLAACLLHRDGHTIAPCVLAPIEAPGRRRVARALGSVTILDAAALEDDAELIARAEQAILAARPDLIVSWFWTRRLPERLFALAPLGAVGVHPSLLPRHRGPDPFYWAIDSGDAVTGVTAHVLTANYDEGDVLGVETLPIGDRNAWQLARALDRPSLRVLRRTVGALLRGDPVPRTPQDESQATWAPSPSGEALRADFRWPTERVLRRIRALSPIPGLALSVRGVDLTVIAAEPCADYPRVLLPGEAAVWGDPPRVLVVTGDGAIAITKAEITGDEDEPCIVHGDELAHRVRHASRDARDV